MRAGEAMVAETPVDTPRSAMSLLSRRATLSTAAILVGLAAVAWFLTWRQSAGMMVTDLTAPLFMSMWLTMMVAMMFPTVAPMVFAHRMVVLKRGEGNIPTIAFVAGYLSVWTVIGFVPLAGLLTFQAIEPHLNSRWLEVGAGGVLVLAGLYQFTPWKSFCIKGCRTPIGFILTHDFGGGASAAFRAGISHGLYCLGCCWALMAVLVIVGLMNLAWMAVIAVVFLLEKNWRHGVGVSKVAGLAVLALGIAVAVFPDILGWLSGRMSPSAM
jgi:predicted metal-binding membrane protein